jgi:hypothetical protein
MFFFNIPRFVAVDSPHISLLKLHYCLLNRTIDKEEL